MRCHPLPTALASPLRNTAPTTGLPFVRLCDTPTPGKSQPPVVAAELRDRDENLRGQQLSETIEPILLGIMGVMVGILLLGVFTPLWDLGQATLHPTGH